MRHVARVHKGRGGPRHDEVHNMFAAVARRFTRLREKLPIKVDIYS